MIGSIVAALAFAALVAWFAWLGHRETLRRIDRAHHERMAERGLLARRPFTGTAEDILAAIRGAMPASVAVEVRHVKVPGMEPGVLKVEVRSHG
jgi:hypothetical protein